jgi:hypothetical protein
MCQQAPKLATRSGLLGKILIELYAEHLFPLIPVMEYRDLSDSVAAPIVRQALYLAGSMMQQPKDYPSKLKPKDFFLGIKMLLSLYHQHDAFAVLKCLCVLSCWSWQSPTKATIDTPWRWSGMAIRLPIQLSLHKEATYSRLENRQCARRIWWLLLVSQARKLFQVSS